MAKAFRGLKPDLVMVLGDRLEILAATNAALAEQIPIAHVHGGETAPGQWDEQIRHAVTKIAHLHFCATTRAGQRILRMGEDPKKVHVVGAPALDAIGAFAREHPEFRGPRAQDGWVGGSRPVLVLLHPSSRDDAAEEKRARIMLEAIGRLPFSVIGPNNDPGHRGILKAYERLALPVTMSVTQEDFWTMLAQTSFLIGNSSAGILEAASLATPVINLGDRQAGRERNANVIDVPWEGGEAGIRAAIRKARSTAFEGVVGRRKNVYGDGHASARIVRVLEGLKLPLGIGKRFYDAR
jgi:UDP-hydrolysing UDP-N-acetyl-D-glucosamine 2-epimerase